MIYKADGGPHKVLSRQQLLFLQDQEAQSDPGRALVIGDQHFDTAVAVRLLRVRCFAICVCRV